MSKRFLLSLVLCALASTAVCARTLREAIALPDPIDTQAELDARISALRAHYGPFARDLVGPAGYRKTIDITQEPWQFRLDDSNAGASERWMDGWNGEGWSAVTLPDFREYVRGWYRVRCSLPSLKGRQAFLVCDGLDYEGVVYVNGKAVGVQRDFPGPFEMNITDAVKAENALYVSIYNAEDSARRVEGISGKGMGSITFHPEYGIDQHGNGAGILGRVRIELRGPAHFKHALISPSLSGHLVIDVSATDALWREARSLQIEALPKNFKGKATTLTLKNMASCPDRPGYRRVELDVADPRLWTPDGTYLYVLRITALDGRKTLDGWQSTFGIRTVEMAADGSVLFNGKPRYLRGACNFGGFNLAGVRAEWATMERDILLYRAANLELMRIHLGLAHPRFNEMCDVYGLMVYQDTTLQWGYPLIDNNTQPAPRFRAQLISQIRQRTPAMYNHPSVIVWELMNEFWSCPKGFRNELVALQRQLDPTRLVVANSGDPAPIPGESQNDGHNYAGWYSLVAKSNDVDYHSAEEGPMQATPPDYLGRRTGGRLIMSEYGGCAYPDWETWQERFPWAPASPDVPWDPASVPTELCYRGLSLGNRIQNINLTWRIGKWSTAREWIERSQSYQDFLIRMQTDVWRRRRAQLAGYCQFHLIDPAPLAWPKAIVDCQRRPKLAYYGLLQSSAPRRINIQFDRYRFIAGRPIKGYSAWVYNDTYDPIRSEGRWFLVDKADNILADARFDVNVPADSSTLVHRLKMNIPSDYTGDARLVLAMLDSSGKVIDFDQRAVRIYADEKPKSDGNVLLYDPLGRTRPALSSVLHVEYQPWEPGRPLPQGGSGVLLIGQFACDATLAAAGKQINAWVEQGGQVVLLNQIPARPAGRPGPRSDTVLWWEAGADKPRADLSWLPFQLKIETARSPAFCDCIQWTTRCAAFHALDLSEMRFWNGYEGVIVDYPFDPASAGTTLVSCYVNMAYPAVLRAVHGKGAFVASQLLLVGARAFDDPVARKLLGLLLHPDALALDVDLSVSRTIQEKNGQPRVQLTVRNVGRKTIAAAAADKLGDRVLLDGRKELEPGQTAAWDYDIPGDVGALVLLPPAEVRADGAVFHSGADVVLSAGKGSVVRAFDMGPSGSPVMKGFTPVDETMRYDAARGFGWTGPRTPASRDRGEPDDLRRDFVFLAAPGGFRVDLPNGKYRVTLVRHDSDFPCHPITLTANGRKLLEHDGAPVGATLVRTFDAEAADGALNLDFTYEGDNWSIGALVITRG